VFQLSPDFRDMLNILNEEGAEYLMVGAYAMAAHGHPRATGDMDLWVRPTAENAHRVWKALRKFGAPLLNLTEPDLAVDDIVFQIGVPPNRIDFLTSISAVEFEDAWADRQQIDLAGIPAFALSRRHLLQNKQACNRPKDWGDIAWLELQLKVPKRNE
jgi:hypothetical protein